MNTETCSNDKIFRKQLNALDKSENVFAGVEMEVDKKGRDDDKMLLIKIKSKKITVSKESIMYVESNRRKKVLHMADDIIEIYSTMNDLKCRLGDDFYQCHRGYIVNMAYITEYTSDSIKISSGEIIYMAKEKYNDFEKVYMGYLTNN